VFREHNSLSEVGMADKNKVDENFVEIKESSTKKIISES